MAAGYPLVNGTFYEFADMTVAVNGPLLELAFKSVNYKTSKKRGNVYGTHPEKLGTTRGKVESEGSIEMFKSAFDNLTSLISALGTLGMMEVAFPITIVYGNPTLGQPLITDVLFVNGIEEIDEGHSESIDALTVKASLNLARIVYNGKTALGPVNSLQGLPTI